MKCNSASYVRLKKTHASRSNILKSSSSIWQHTAIQEMCYSYTQTNKYTNALQRSETFLVQSDAKSFYCCCSCPASSQQCNSLVGFVVRSLEENFCCVDRICSIFKEIILKSDFKEMTADSSRGAFSLMLFSVLTTK